MSEPHAPEPHEPELREQELRDWLRLSLTPGIGPILTQRLLRAFGLPREVFAAAPWTLAALVGERLASRLLHPDRSRDERIDAALAWAEGPGCRLQVLADPDYPRRLLDLADPPPVLYLKGRTGLLERPMLAIVGSRYATRSGEHHAFQFGQALGARGWTVISGLAAGIDSAAHRGALPTAGGTAAVIGQGPDRAYPASHRALMEEIGSIGLVLSEYPPGTSPVRAHFPRRNRLIAALSQGALVVEATRDSGSLITARLAADLGREVFAMPGSIDAPMSKGCHALIRQGAKLTETVEDLLVELPGARLADSQSSPDRLAPAGAARASAGAGAGPCDSSSPRGPGAESPSAEGPSAEDPDCRRVMEALDWDPAPLDALADRSGLSAPALAAALALLNLDGRIEIGPDGRARRPSA